MMELQGEIGKSTIIVGECNTPFWVIDRFRRQNFSTDKNDSKSTHHQHDPLIFIESSIQQQQNTYSSQIQI